MKRKKSPYFKQEPILYFDENFPYQIVWIFRSPYWKKRVRVSSALDEGNLRKSDDFHYDHCKWKGYTLVSLDLDFNHDGRFPFTFGNMPGIIMVRVRRSDVAQIISCLSRLLDFLISIRFPKAFIAETKFVASSEGVVVRGRDLRTRKIKTLHIEAGLTTRSEILGHFSY